MTIAAGVSAKGRTGSGSAAVTASVTTSVAGSIFVCACYWGGSQTFVSLGDTKGNVYTQIGTEQTSGTDKSRLYYIENGVGGAGHVATLTVSGTTGVTLLMQEITGGLTSGSLDQNGARTDAASPFTLAAGLTTVQADELLITALFGDSGSNPGTHAETGLGLSTIQAEETDGTTFWTGAEATAVKSATGTFNPSWTESGATAGMVFLATFKAAIAAGITVKNLAAMGVG